MKTSIRDQVNAMDAASYFKLFAELLKTNPPVAEDAPMVASLPRSASCRDRTSTHPSSIPLSRRALRAFPSRRRTRSWLG